METDRMKKALVPFTRTDQVDRLIDARESNPDLGFMGRLMTLCSLPRTNPGNRTEYVRRNGPYALFMNATRGAGLPYGPMPRLLLAWMCTEAVKRRWCMNRNWPTTNPTHRSITYQERTTMAYRARPSG